MVSIARCRSSRFSVGAHDLRGSSLLLYFNPLLHSSGVAIVLDLISLSQDYCRVAGWLIIPPAFDKICSSPSATTHRVHILVFKPSQFFGSVVRRPPPLVFRSRSCRLRPNRQEPPAGECSFSLPYNYHSCSFRFILMCKKRCDQGVVLSFVLNLINTRIGVCRLSWFNSSCFLGVF